MRPSQRAANKIQLYVMLTATCNASYITSGKESKPMRGVVPLGWGLIPHTWCALPYTMKDSPQPHCSSEILLAPHKFTGRGRAGQIRRGHTYVGILENKSLVQLVFRPVHLAANNAEQGLAIYEHLDSVLLDHLIKCPGLFDIFQVVRETAASTIPYSNFDEFWLGLVQHRSELLYGRWCEFHRRFSRLQLWAWPCSFRLLCARGLFRRGRFYKRSCRCLLWRRPGLVNLG